MVCCMLVSVVAAVNVYHVARIRIRCRPRALKLAVALVALALHVLVLVRRCRCRMLAVELLEALVNLEVLAPVLVCRIAGAGH